MEILVAHEVDAGLPSLAIGRQFGVPAWSLRRGANKRRLDDAGRSAKNALQLEARDGLDGSAYRGR